MSKKIKENFNKKGFAIVKNVLNYKSDIKPVLNDLDCKLNTLIGKYFTTKEQSRLYKLPFQDRYFIQSRN